MTTKDFGPGGTSMYLDPTGRAWETVGFSPNKPVLDRELVLLQDLAGSQATYKSLMPSGWLSSDFLNTTTISTIVGAGSGPNTLQFSAMTAHVNGWLVKVQNSNMTGGNLVQLDPGPTDPGTQRTDIVILEVWRRTLLPKPSIDGKSPTSLIWQQGNVLTNPSADATLNYPDDIEDPSVGETTRRIQIQYRLRVIDGVDLFAHPHGLDDPNVFASTVPSSASLPFGTPTTFHYGSQSLVGGDSGLWAAGDGNPANGLGTSDGYMYAIPLVAVFRRNSSPYSKFTNQNGGAASPGPTDRPDNMFCDVIASDDIFDMRHGVSPRGWNLTEVVEKTTNAVLDNTLRTEIGRSTAGGGSSGPTLLLVDEITDAASTAGVQIASFDNVRRRFSDRAIYESVTVVLPAPSGGWNNATVNLSPNALAVYPYAAFDWASRNVIANSSYQVRILDVVEMHWAGSAAPLKYSDALPYVQSITGLGSVPVGSLSITLGTTSTLGLTTEPLYVTLLVGYASGAGLTQTPTAWYSTGTIQLTGNLPTASPVSYSALSVTNAIDVPHREADIEYTTSTLSLTMATPAGTAIQLPERAVSISNVTLNGSGASATLSSSGRTVQVTTTAGQTLSLSYVAQRPVPGQVGTTASLSYRAAAPQMVRSSLLGTHRTLTVRYCPQTLYVITAGSGSQDEAYPFPVAYAQTGGVRTGAYTYPGEHDLSSSAEVSLSDFTASTGFLRLPAYIPMVAASDSFLTGNSVANDIENRSYSYTINNNYYPNAYASDLSLPMRHKNVLPVLIEPTSTLEPAWGKQGSLMLAMFVRYASIDDTNGVWFENVPTSSLVLFRVKGLLLNNR